MTILIIIVLLVILVAGWVMSTQRRLVVMDENINNAMSQIGVQLSSRFDALTALLDLAKGYAAHESETLGAVTDARARAASISLSAGELTPAKLAEFQEAQAGVRSALGRLIAVAESYPDLKANQNFLELQAQIEGTENRIAVARKEFNDAARHYNVAVRRFPANLVAGLFGFAQKPYFESAEGTDAAPEVKF